MADPGPSPSPSSMSGAPQQAKHAPRGVGNIAFDAAKTAFDVFTSWKSGSSSNSNSNRSS